MKPNTLIALVILALLLGGLAYWNQQPRRPSAQAAETRLWPGLAVNEVRKIVITTPTSTLTIARGDADWIVPSHYDYPANYDKIVETLTTLAELKIGQTIVPAGDLVERLHLLPPTNLPPEKAAHAGALLELFDLSQRRLAAVTIGRHFMRKSESGGMDGFGDYPDGQYVRRMEDGKVCVVAKTLDRLVEQRRSWLEDDFLNVTPGDVQTIEVTGPERTPIQLIREKDAPLMTLSGVGTNETADAGKISQMVGALNYLSFDDVAAPTLTAQETGMDAPLTFVARTKQGRVYSLQVGKPVATNMPDRYLRVAVAYEAPPARPAADTNVVTATTNQTAEVEANRLEAEEVARLNALFAPWTYVVKSYRAESLLLKREDLIKKEPPPDAETNTAAAAEAPAEAEVETVPEKVEQ